MRLPEWILEKALLSLASKPEVSRPNSPSGGKRSANSRGDGEWVWRYTHSPDVLFEISYPSLGGFFVWSLFKKLQRGVII